MTKLDEIITKISKESLLYGRKQYEIDFAKAVALEFAKHILEEAAENVTLIQDCGNKTKENCNAVFCRNCIEVIDKQSITDTLNKYL